MLLPSAFYFIPRHLFVNISSGDVDTSSRPSQSFEETLQNCSQGFLDLTQPGAENICVPSCDGFLLDDGINSISIYRLVLMIASSISCAAGLGFVLLAITVAARKNM
jgi:hypothetical protein